MYYTEKTAYKLKKCDIKNEGTHGTAIKIYFMFSSKKICYINWIVHTWGTFEL